MLKAKKNIFIRGNVVNFFIVYELDIWSLDLHTDLTLKDSVYLQLLN